LSVHPVFVLQGRTSEDSARQESKAIEELLQADDLHAFFAASSIMAMCLSTIAFFIFSRLLSAGSTFAA
jgi:hypothetical protein